MPKNEALAPYLFHQGTNYHSYQYLGAHKEEGEYVFRVWAPNAYVAFVVGDFNGWEETHPMERVSDGGIFEGRVAASIFGAGSLYKYKLKTPHGDRYKADPYGTYMPPMPETATASFDIEGY